MGYERDTSSGLTHFETEVLELWESGLSVERIARVTDTSRARVGKIVVNFGGGGEQRADESAIGNGSANLLAAIHAARQACPA